MPVGPTASPDQIAIETDTVQQAGKNIYTSVQGPGVHYAMYDASYDPIPLLSSYENPVLSQIPNPVSTSPQLPPIVPPNISVPVALGSVIGADQLPWNARHAYIDPTGQYGNQIHNISDVGNISPWGDGSSANPLYNHIQYQNSNQLDAPTPMSTGGTSNIGNIGNIDPSSLGPTEYFGMQNTNNFGARSAQAGQFGQQVFSNLLNTPPAPAT